MDKKLSRNEFFSIALMLFAMFFGSGNLIFPPMLGNQAGSSMWVSLLGFSLTAVVFPVLGILAIAKTEGVEKLGKRVGPLFAIIYPAIIFLSIGPGIAIPRNGSLAFEMSVVPYLSADANLVAWRLAYTIVFFALAYYLCLTPSKLVDRMGKLMTPVLLILILIFFLGVVVKLPTGIAGSQEAYNKPLLKGFIEGYNTMDTLASLNFGLVIALTIKRYKVEKESEVIKYASVAGLISGLLLFIVYAMLAYAGQINSQALQNPSNGGFILYKLTDQVFGPTGGIVLILIFSLACLTTVVGLITSVSEYFTGLFKNKLSYKFWTILFTLVSLLLANFGLDKILVFSVPVLVAIYPVAIVLIVMALLQDWVGFSSRTYKIGVYVTFAIAILQGLRMAKIKLDLLDIFISQLPFFNDGLEWVIPAFIILLIGGILDRKANR